MTIFPLVRVTLAPKTAASLPYSIATARGNERGPHTAEAAPLPTPDKTAPHLHAEATPLEGEHALDIALHQYAPGTLAKAIYLSGVVTPPPLCSGIGHCGQCQVRFLSSPPLPLPEDSAFFSQEALQAGWRLACHHPCAAGIQVELPPTAKLTEQALRQISHPNYQEATDTPHPGATARRARPPVNAATETTSTLPVDCGLAVGCGLALDLGTTSLHCRLTDPAGVTLWETSRINPQMGAGSDVISRLATAQDPQGAAQLHRVTLSALQELAATASRHGTISTGCLAANPAMTALALGVETAPLASAPYSLPHPGSTWEHLEGLPALWIPPQVSPFVGGDISAGYAALLALPTPPAFPFLLADLGTNGELLLALSPTQAVVTSVALGPALEGIGLACGTLAEQGAVTGFTLTPQGLHTVFYRATAPHNTAAGMNTPPHQQGTQPPHQQGTQPGHNPGHQHTTQPGQPESPQREQPEGTQPPPSGITATGYLSLLQCLLSSGALQRDGHYTPERSPLLQRFLQRYGDAPCPCPLCRGSLPPPRRHRSGEPWIPLPHNLYVTATDIEEILKVKAAFSLGLALLLEHARVHAHNLTAIYVAGALGAHATPTSLASLGFFPSGVERRIVISGNTALQGAALLAQNAHARDALDLWAQGVTALDLAATPAFMQGFPSHMRFMW